MIHISAVIICRDEQEKITDCIKSLTFVHEIIVIDNGSQDNTVQVAKELGAKVHTVRGLDFSYLRNIGKEKIKSEWILYIDADERISEKLAVEMQEAVKVQEVAAYRLHRKNYYFNQKWPIQERMIRLIRKNALIGWQGVLHESAIVAGRVKDLQEPLLHYTHDNLSTMVHKTNEWSELEAQLRYMSNHPRMVPWRFLRVMISAFWNSYVHQKGWKAGTIGLIESVYQSYSMFITYAKLWEKQHRSLTHYGKAKR